MNKGVEFLKSSRNCTGYFMVSCLCSKLIANSQTVSIQQGNDP